MTTTHALAPFESSNYPILAGEVSIPGFLQALEKNTGGQPIGAANLTQIRFPSGGSLSFQVHDAFSGDNEVREVSGVIIHHNFFRTYWKTSVEEGGGGTPSDCWSDDLVTGIGDPGGSCRTCPYARFGSADKGKGQACGQRRRLFVLREGEMLPSLLVVPPSSLKTSVDFMLGLASRAIAHELVVVQLSLEKAQNGAGVAFSKLKMKATAKLTGDQATSITEYAMRLQPLLQSIRVEDQVAEAGEPSQREPIDLDG